MAAILRADRGMEPDLVRRVGSRAFPRTVMNPTRFLRSSVLLATGVLLAPGVASAQVELRGRLVSSEGLPIAGAAVTLVGVGFSVTSDSLGRFALAGKAGSTLRLQFAASGFRRDSASVVLWRSASMERDFTLVTTDTPPEANPSSEVLRGRVLDATGQTLSYANIQVNGGRRFVTDDSGRFQVPRTTTGRINLLVRRIGYEPAEVKLPAPPDTALRIELTAIPTLLKEVVVSGASAYRSLDINGFYRRMRDAEKGINHGYFITPEDIDRRKPTWTSQLADGFPTVRVFRSPRPYADRILGALGCTMTVYLDNIRIIGKLGPGDEPVNLMAPINHVAAMEIYPRAVSAPPQYQPLNGTCGVVLIWTK